ncbi:LuxR C-terminal-related transcriptional regulator [Gordonia sp. NB41Y]|uniref:LuxR C-terminal-related transcriptional regulator n=1 Tax=Gordonia sp. NB41Y TaxID=875808 RepID=UPI00273B1CEA|nr:LuxR C-terminal-related transcriptional regulator [Gordonia sp. NB41Y]WLP92597.1 LuxR C-terminal-related transcriptional regulator [Gordonia sp. NB41Y]
MASDADSGRNSTAPTGPVVRNIVLRADVLNRLDGVLRADVFVVCAPAGYGKSLAMAAWLDSRMVEQVAWANLGAVGESASRLWSAVIDGFVRMAGDDGELAAVAVLADRAPAEVPRRLAGWIARRSGPVVLVLDDLHGVTGPEAHEQVQQLVAVSPAGLHIVCITRHDPPWPLHRMRLDVRIDEIRTDLFRFDVASTMALFESLDLSLGPAIATALVDRTQGWAAGIRLAALGAANSDDPEGFVDGITGRTGYIADYLLKEVYQRMPPAWRDLLIRVSVVDVVCPELAEALGAGVDGEATLVQLAREHAFVHELGDQPGWFRLHPLLLDFLRSRIHDQRELLDLHRRAAQWYADQGRPLVALGHAISAHDWDAAATLVGRHAVTWTVCRNPFELKRILDGVALDEVLARPGLATGAAAVRAMAGLTAEIEGFAVAARSRLDTCGSARPRLELLLDLIDIGYRRWTGDVDGMLAGCRRVNTDPAALAGSGLTDWPVIGVLVTSNTGSSELWTGEIEPARSHLIEAATATAGPPIMLPVLNARAHLAYLQWRCGELTSADDRAREAIAGFAEAGIPAAAHAASAYLALVGVSLDRDDLDAADAWVQAAAASAIEPHTLLVLAMMRVRILLRRGAAYDAASVMRDAVTGTGFDVVPAALRREAEALGSVVAAYVDSGSGRRGHVDAPALPDRPTTRELVEYSLAVASNPAVDQQIRTELIDRALAAAAAEDLRRPFLERAEQIRDLLAGRIERGSPQADFALGLLRRMPSEGRRTADDGRFVPLSAREMEILHHLVGSMTISEIAGALYISVNTVKTHQRAVYQKLGVSGRREAVTRARSLRLL